MEKLDTWQHVTVDESLHPGILQSYINKNNKLIKSENAYIQRRFEDAEKLQRDNIHLRITANLLKSRVAKYDKHIIELTNKIEAISEELKVSNNKLKQYEKVYNMFNTNFNKSKLVTYILTIQDSILPIAPRARMVTQIINYIQTLFPS
jgi:chromosome segregation ATPase